MQHAGWAGDETCKMGMGTDQPGSTRQPLTSKTSFAPLGITSVANSGDAAAPDRHVADTVDVPPEPLWSQACARERT